VPVSSNLFSTIIITGGTAGDFWAAAGNSSGHGGHGKFHHKKLAKIRHASKL
jgi:hypothetical protein